MAQRPISSIVRLQPMQKPLFWSSLQIPMHGDVTRLSIDIDGSATEISGLLAEEGELVLQLVELALEVVDHDVLLRRRA